VPQRRFAERHACVGVGTDVNPSGAAGHARDGRAQLVRENNGGSAGKISSGVGGEDLGKKQHD
jgi:hypothetical protein